MDLIQIRRGLEENLPNLAQGELGFTLDTKKLYVGGVNGNVSINPINNVNVKSYGAIGDGISDDTEFVINAISNLKDGDILFFPIDKYKITSTLFINKNVDVIMEGSIEYYGENLALKINDEFSSSYNRIITLKLINKNLSNRPDGIEISNIVSSEINLEVFHFNKGVKLMGENRGFGYNNIYPKILQGNKISLQLVSKLNGWVNQNTFIGGSLGWVKAQVVDDSYIHLEFVVEGANGINQNAFFNVAMEATSATQFGASGTAIKLATNSYNNFFYNCRFENIKYIDLASSKLNRFLYGLALEGVEILNKGQNSITTKSKSENVSDGSIVSSFQSYFSSSAKLIQFLNSAGVEKGFITGNGDINSSSLTANEININSTKILTGTSSPKDTVVANVGSLYLYRLSNASQQLWIKTSGNDTSVGWTPLQTIYSMPSNYRPSTPTKGFSMFDETLGKPIWWNGIKWINALGEDV